MSAQSAIHSSPDSSVSWTPQVASSVSAGALTCLKTRADCIAPVRVWNKGDKVENGRDVSRSSTLCPHFLIFSICYKGNGPLNGPMRTLLFLIADTGAGHRSAANAIRNAINLISQKEQEEWLAQHAHRQDADGDEAVLETEPAPPPTYRIEIVDVFEEYSRFPLREAVKLYGPTIRYNPRLYGEVFRRSNREKTVVAVDSIATPLIFNGLLRLLTTVQPDIVVS